MAVRILIADDHGVLRAGLRALLSGEPDFAVVGEAATGQEALALAAELRPDVALIDLSMPSPRGLEVTRQLTADLPGTRVLILTVHEDAGLLREAIRAGAAGYIVKRAVESELVNAIRAVHRGDLYVHPAMTRFLVEDGGGRRSQRQPGAAAMLTPRETDVLRLIASGYTNRQIAEELQLSVRTVETHRANIMGKLGLRTRAELVRWATENRLVG
jgi:DNA-binding NarL/FixJ family response regulator